MLGVAMLEGADGEEEEPSNTASSTTRVNTTNVLNETGQEDAPPKRSPLENGLLDCAC